MSEVLVVVLGAGQDVPNHRGATAPTSPDQIAFAERFQQGFGLIEPGRITRGQQHVHAWRQVAQELSAITADVAGAVVHDQMDPAGPTVGMQQTSQGRTKMLAIILVQALGPHMPGVNRQARQQVERAMPDVIKFLTLALTGAHRLFGRGPFQNLQVGLLVHGQDHFALVPQALDSLVIPEDLEGSFDRFLIPDRGLPPPQAMRMQIGCAQDVADGHVRDAVDQILLHGGLRQAALRPMCLTSTHGRRFTTGEPFNPVAFASGKKRAGDRSGAHRTTRLANSVADSVRTPARWWPHPVQSFHRVRPPVVGHWLGPTGSGRAARPWPESGHHATAGARKSCPLLSTETCRASDHAWLISRSLSKQMSNAITACHGRPVYRVRLGVEHDAGDDVTCESQPGYPYVYDQRPIDAGLPEGGFRGSGRFAHRAPQTSACARYSCRPSPPARATASTSAGIVTMPGLKMTWALLAVWST